MAWEIWGWALYQAMGRALTWGDSFHPHGKPMKQPCHYSQTQIGKQTPSKTARVSLARALKSPAHRTIGCFQQTHVTQLTCPTQLLSEATQASGWGSVEALSFPFLLVVKSKRTNK